MISNNYSTALTQANYAEEIRNINRFFDDCELKVPDKTRPLSNPALEEFFTTEEGKDARAMNRAALNMIKKGSMERPKAKEPEDIELFSSNEAEKVKKWVRWVDPKSGKLYTIINKGDNPDGTRRVRVLNEEGEVVKETDIKPKKIIVLDIFNNDDFYNMGEIEGSHGGLVQKIIERNNPIADIESVNLGDDTISNKIDNDKLNAAIDDILERIKQGEKIDVVNCSFSCDYSPWTSNEEIITKYEHKLNLKKILVSYPCAKDIIEDEHRLTILHEKIKQLISSGTHVVFIAGNCGDESFNAHACIDGADIVGGLGANGKIYNHCASRAFLKHLELSEYKPKLLKEGINITGLPGADFPYKDEVYKKLAGKKLEDCPLASREDCLEFLNLYKDLIGEKISQEEFDEACKKFETKIVDDCQEKLIIHGSDIIIRNAYDLDDLNMNFIPIEDGNTENFKKGEARTLEKNSRFFRITKDGRILPKSINLSKRQSVEGTSYAAPTRSAKIALNMAMKEILDE